MASLTGGALPMAFQSLTLCSSRLAFPRSQILGVSLSTLSDSLCLFSSPPTFPSVIYCGRGDKRTAKGKRFKHSFGNARPRNKKKGRGPPRVPVPPSGPRKDKFDDGEIVKIEIDESLFSS